MSSFIVNDVPPRVQYTANGATTVFTFPFPVIDATDLKVWFGDGDPASSYTVSGLAQTAGGQITFAAAPANGTRVTILRDMPVRRLTDFQDSGEFRAAAINDELDRLALMVQQVEFKADRAMTLDPTSPVATLAPPPAVADGYFRWNASATALVADNTVPTAVTTSAANAAAAATGATNAATSATNAATSATGAANSATAAAASAASIQGVKTIAVAGQSDVVADATADTLTLAAGSNVTLTTDPANDTVTIAAAGVSYTEGAGIDITAGVVSLDPSTYTSAGLLFATSPLKHTASGTWTKPTGLKFIVVEVLGGGGGGASAAASATFYNQGGGGAGGGYARKTILAAALGATEAVTIGAGGAGGNPGAGATGGTSSFGAHVSATGGGGGSGPVAPDQGAAGGTPPGNGSGGDYHIAGQRGEGGMAKMTAVCAYPNLMGRGGNSHLGPGYAVSSHGGNAAGAWGAGGNADPNTGGGGQGGCESSRNVAYAGGNGGSGLVIIWEFK